jgi:hypothetical protein
MLIEETTGHIWAEVLKIDPQHRFDNGTVQEGCVMRNKFGTEVWLARARNQKMELVRRPDRR